MRSPARREDTTVTIATALFLFVGVLAAGVGVTYAVTRFDAGHGAKALLMLVTVVLAATLSLRYLIVHRRPT